jgi:hypothetical protein
MIDSANGTWMTSKLHSKKVYLPSSYPVPFRRINADHKTMKMLQGYVNTSSATNPSDPSSLLDNGPNNNGITNVQIQTLP